MLNLSVHLLSGPKEFEELEEYSNAHWDDYIHSGDTHNDFFDTPKYIVTAFEGEQKVGQLYIFPRNIVDMETPMFFAGIGGVVTHKQFRHQGIGTKMMETTKDFLMKNNFDFAVLCTDLPKLESFYAASGYEVLSKPYLFTDKTGATKEESGGMIQPLNSPDKVKLIQNSPKNLHVGTSNF